MYDFRDLRFWVMFARIDAECYKVTIPEAFMRSTYSYQGYLKLQDMN